MGFILVPEYRFSSFDQVGPSFFESLGIKGVILDIDNTLEPYENAEPGERVISWLDTLSEAGIRTAIVSNNNRVRVDTFNRNIGIPAYYSAAKPFKHNLLRAMRDMGTDATNTIMIGDQIYTDVWAAHNAGISAILVDPIKDKNGLLTKIKRVLERPVIRMYEKKNNDNATV